MRIATTFVMLLALAGTAWAAEIFVDQKLAGADDKNPGTEAKPFKTIQPAVDAAKPRDSTGR